MSFETDVFGDDFFEDTKATTRVHLRNHAARVSAEVLTNDKRRELVWLQPFDDMKR